MGVDLQDWCETMKRHPLKYKFEGIRGFWTSIGEAVTHDERFMEDYLYKEFKGHSDALEEALEKREDIDELLSRYCEFLECRVSLREWEHEGLPTDLKWSTADNEELMRVIEAVGNASRQDKYLRNWCVGDVDQYWDMLKSKDEAEYLLKEHPPEEVWSHAYEEGVPLDEVWFLCPSCHREPSQLKERSQAFYCGLCGSESCLDKNETMLDFFENLDIEVYPFNEGLRKRWEEHFKGYDEVPEGERVAWYTERLKTWKP